MTHSHRRRRLRCDDIRVGRAKDTIGCGFSAAGRAAKSPPRRLRPPFAAGFCRANGGWTLVPPRLGSIRDYEGVAFHPTPTPPQRARTIKSYAHATRKAARHGVVCRSPTPEKFSMRLVTTIKKITPKYSNPLSVILPPKLTSMIYGRIIKRRLHNNT